MRLSARHWLFCCIALFAMRTSCLSAAALTDGVSATDYSKIVVQFSSGLGIRLRSQQFVTLIPPPPSVSVQLAALNSLILQASTSLPGAVEIVRPLSRTETDVDAEYALLRLRTVDLPDLNSFFQIRLPSATTLQQARNFLSALRGSAVVSYAEFETLPTSSAVDIPPVTPLFQGQQGYLNPSATSNGVDAIFAWAVPGGKGDGIQLIDVEYSWQTDHEDLPGLVLDAQYADVVFADRQHGAAALGIVAAVQNTYGMTGIAPSAQLGVSSDRYGTYATRVDAISVATQKLNAGDILLLEMQQYTAEPYSTACGCPAPGCLVPVDVVDSIFSAIQIAVAKGVVVVESAGNGATDLDASCFAGRFNRTVRDSGAIMVGAGSSLARETLSFST